jgi:hypothetical protein
MFNFTILLQPYAGILFCCYHYETNLRFSVYPKLDTDLLTRVRTEAIFSLVLYCNGRDLSLEILCSRESWGGRYAVEQWADELLVSCPTSIIGFICSIFLQQQTDIARVSLLWSSSTLLTQYQLTRRHGVFGWPKQRATVSVGSVLKWRARSRRVHALNRGRWTPY